VLHREPDRLPLMNRDASVTRSSEATAMNGTGRFLTMALSTGAMMVKLVVAR